jgi:hypothetical protein
VFVPALGRERSVTNDALVVHEHARYCVPDELAQARARMLFRTLNRRVRTRTTLESEFLAIGDGATLWLHAVAGTGATRIHAKMQHVIDLGGYHEHAHVAAALELAAAASCFDHADLDSTLLPQAIARPGQRTSALDAPSWQSSTRSWDGFGR